MSATCKSCGAPIVWAVGVASGKRMPLDAGPVAAGVRFTIDPTGKAYVVTDPNVTGLRSHFATCPDADKHRRPR